MDRFGDCGAAHDKAMLTLAPGVIDLWRFPLDRFDPSPAELTPLLSPDELHRARRFHFTKDRDRFIFVRGSVRIVLGGYLGLRPECVEFCYGKAGKPALGSSINPRDLRFNVAHSGELALVAVAWGRELGVDIEQIRPGVNIREVARQFFSPPEVTEIFTLPAARQTAAFFDCWTRKEAYVKATGEGLSCPLHSFGVSVQPDGPARLTFVDGHAAELKRWRLQDISPDSSHAAAIAVEGEGWEICYRNPASTMSPRAGL